MRQAISTSVLIVVSLVAAVVVDLILVPGYPKAATYAIPVLIAAYFAPPLAVWVTAGLAVLLNLISGHLQDSVPWDWPLRTLPLLVVSVAIAYLAALLSSQKQELARRARREQDLSVRLRMVGRQLALKARDAQQAMVERGQIANQMRLLLDSTDEGIFEVDPQGRCTFVNKSAAEMLGYGPESLLGKSIYEITHPSHLDGSPYPVEEFPVYHALQTGEGFRTSDVVLWRRDGTSFPVEYSSYPVIEDGAILGAVVTIIDITERKRAEEYREEYVSLISHDLRNPLTPLIGMADWLRRVLAKQDLSREARTAESMLTNARRMNAMIQDLVDSARWESGQLEMRKEMTDLSQLISDIARRVGSYDDRMRIQLESPECVPPVAVDVDRFERATINLITNALKYSPPESNVVVRVAQSNDEALVSVHDQGMGIPADELPYIFDRFYRAKTGKKVGEGLGLGLYITRLIAEAHGGRIWVESEVGKGSTFTFALPLA